MPWRTFESNLKTPEGIKIGFIIYGCAFWLSGTIRDNELEHQNKNHDFRNPAT